MGYCIQQGETKFSMRNYHHEPMRVKLILDTIEQHRKGAYYPWVNPQYVVDAKNIKEMFQAWRYEPTFNEAGDIVHLTFFGQKLGACFEMFKLIAPAVEAGSFISMHGEDGDIWRWVFDGVDCKEVRPNLDWGSAPSVILEGQCSDSSQPRLC